MVKKYKLVIKYDISTGEVLRLSEEFSDLEVFKININGRIMEMPEEMQKLLGEGYEDTLGVC